MLTISFLRCFFFCCEKWQQREKRRAEILNFLWLFMWFLLTTRNYPTQLRGERERERKFFPETFDVHSLFKFQSKFSINIPLISIVNLENHKHRLLNSWTVHLNNERWALWMSSWRFWKLSNGIREWEREMKNLSIDIKRQIIKFVFLFFSLLVVW